MDKKEAMKILKDFHDKSALFSVRTALETLHPELKESEDERMVNQLHSWMNEFGGAEEYTEKVYQWLKGLIEKQGKEKPLSENEYERVINALKEGFKYHQLFNPTFGGIPCIEIVNWLEKQGEQKLPIEKLPSEMKTIGESLGFTTQEECDEYNQIVSDCIMSDNKGEQKFKVGDWVVCEVTGSVSQIKNCIENLSNHKCGYDLTNGGYICSDEVDHYHLWTIQDAKDGDVLYECNEKKPFIFKELKTKHIGDIASYCDIFNGIFNPNEDSWTTLDIVPATKEQRDLLFSKMHEAGYEWDADKLELKKIEQEFAEWSEEDEQYLLVCKNALAKYQTTDKWDADIISCWLENKLKAPQNTWKPSELPHWKKSSLPSDKTTGFNSGNFCYNGYYINYKELFDKLPKDD